MQLERIRIGTRGSPLALAQANAVRDGLVAATGLAAEAVEVVVIKTTGDKVLDRPLSELGGKGLFTKEIEDGLLDGSLDLAVHSAKDVPTVLPDGLSLAGFLPREDVRDAFISLKVATLDDLPVGAVVGTASLRRGALVKRLRPDLEVVNFRGNVQSRLRKLEAGEVDATLLAMAGLNRLGRPDVATAVLDPERFPPALGQGAIAIETRSDHTAIREALAPLLDQTVGTCLAAERAFLAELDGSCRTPIAGLARIEADTLSLYGLIATPDGRRFEEEVMTASPAEAETVGRELGAELRARGGPAFFADWV
ncbi:hydroxymethylbilane synthase [Amorphus orientalis]|uniref:Porphobilinogen deaminase n=1 Tax=Amorphus orientalis TaxID=649198 RepID=A0AAE3VN95_9HYPH|nr:hydroxymethylbilane synthase [Amorphus orientalis]MDQ0315182.1 hydroxymethylbilane synthase [Amorphus orientalis]